MHTVISSQAVAVSPEKACTLLREEIPEMQSSAKFSDALSKNSNSASRGNQDKKAPKKEASDKFKQNDKFAKATRINWAKINYDVFLCPFFPALCTLTGLNSNHLFVLSFSLSQKQKDSFSFSHAVISLSWNTEIHHILHTPWPYFLHHLCDLCSL